MKSRVSAGWLNHTDGGSRFDDRTTGIVAKYAPKALLICSEFVMALGVKGGESRSISVFAVWFLCCFKARAAEKDGSGGIIHINIDKSTFGKVPPH